MILSEYFSDDMKRRAEVHTHDDCYRVEFYQDEQFVRSVVIELHTQQYAEDCAENWTLGVIKE